VVTCSELTVLLLLSDSGSCIRYIFWAKGWMVGVQVLTEERLSLFHTYQTGSVAHPASCQLDTVSYLPRVKTTLSLHASMISKHCTLSKRQFCHFKNESCISRSQKASTSQFLWVCTLHFILWREKVVTRLQLDGWAIMFQSCVGEDIFSSLLNRIQTVSRAHHTISLYLDVNGGYDPGSKAAAAWSWSSRLPVLQRFKMYRAIFSSPSSRQGSYSRFSGHNTKFILIFVTYVQYWQPSVTKDFVISDRK
jgi:hypothetical protein